MYLPISLMDVGVAFKFFFIFKNNIVMHFFAFLK